MKILIIKASSLGDIVQSFPVLSYLRERFPAAQIDWVVEHPFSELVRAHPAINSVFEIETKKWRSSPLSWGEMGHFWCQIRRTKYDYVFDLQGNLKSSFVLMQVSAYKKVGFGKKSVPEWPNRLFTSDQIDPPKGKNRREDYLSVVQQTFDDSTPYTAPAVKLHAEKVPAVPEGTLVCAGATWPNKCLSHKQLLDYLKKHTTGPHLFAWGNLAEKQRAETLANSLPDGRVLCRLSLSQLQHVMEASRLVVAMDSLPLHLAATTSTPTVSFFGPSSAKKYAPLGSQHTVFQGACPYGVHFEKRCPDLRTCKTGACMDSIEISDQRLRNNSEKSR